MARSREGNIASEEADLVNQDEGLLLGERVKGAGTFGADITDILPKPG